MNKHELCPTCKPHGHCLFEEAANDIANSVPSKEQQTPLITYEDVTIEALRAHKEIALLRDLAKLCGCPNANKVNPDYPGKENL